MEEQTAQRGYATSVERAAASWGRALGHLSNSIVEANRAATAPFRTPSSDDTTRTAAVDESVAYSDETWTFERSVDRREDLGVGDTVRFTKALTDRDVRTFAEITGDTNRLHLDDEFAEQTRFGGRIVHGTLVSGLISAALARLPGLTIYLSQDVEFRAPVDVGDTVTAVCEIVENLGDERYRLTTQVLDEADDVVIDGEAIVLIDERPGGDDEGPA